MAGVLSGSHWNRMVVEKGHWYSLSNDVGCGTGPLNKNVTQWLLYVVYQCAMDISGIYWYCNSFPRSCDSHYYPILFIDSIGIHCFQVAIHDGQWSATGVGGGHQMDGGQY